MNAFEDRVDHRDRGRMSQRLSAFLPVRALRDECARNREVRAASEERMVYQHPQLTIPSLSRPKSSLANARMGEWQVQVAVSAQLCIYQTWEGKGRT